MSDVAGVGAPLDRALRGSLPCITCGYDLRGISIRGVCPECATAVRAAILYQVDPQAEEFQPILTPRLTAAGIVVWASAALAALLVVWWIRIGEVVMWGFSRPLPMRWAPVCVLALGALSGISVLLLARPSRGTVRWHVIAAVVAGFAYVPLLWAFWEIQMIDVAAPRPYTQYDLVVPGRSHLRLVTDVCLVFVFLGVRPNVRELVRRSLAMRTGRVDRQTLLAMVGAVVVAGIGDFLRSASAGFEPDLREFGIAMGSMLVLVSSLFLTLGMITATIDSWRISRVILMPSPSLRDVLEGDRAGATGG